MTVKPRCTDHALALTPRPPEPAGAPKHDTDHCPPSPPRLIRGGPRFDANGRLLGGEEADWYCESKKRGPTY